MKKEIPAYWNRSFFL